MESEWNERGERAHVSAVNDRSADMRVMGHCAAGGCERAEWVYECAETMEWGVINCRTGIASAAAKRHGCRCDRLTAHASSSPNRLGALVLVYKRH